MTRPTKGARKYCHHPRHAEPCPLPCQACAEECANDAMTSRPTKNDATRSLEFVLRINLDNAAFEEPSVEVARILRKVADDIERVDDPEMTLRDINGNCVGTVRLLESYK